MATASNTDIMNALMEVNSKLGSIEQIALATKSQAEKTNGRVTKIEEWKNALQAVEQYKKEQTPMVKTEKGDVIVQATASKLEAQTKVFLSIAGLITALTVLVGIFGGKL